MIKHRFIVSETDFRIFAAIPTEARILTWKKWRRPPDWPALRDIFETSAGVLEELGSLWADVSNRYKNIAEMKVPESFKGTEMNESEKQTRETRSNQSAETLMLSEICSSESSRSRQLAALLAEATDDDDPVATSAEVRRFLARVSSEVSTGSVDDLVKMANSHCAYYQELLTGEGKRGSSHRTKLKLFSKEEREEIRQHSMMFYLEYEVLLRLFEEISKGSGHAATLVRLIDDFNTFKIPADVECPVGVPFAAYTVELGEKVVVNVVEGHAWAERAEGDRREATEAEKTATEIVSQMLVERGQNPKAPTRIAVREVDPGHAHEQRQAEARGGPPKVRTIKFLVAPPRYLRDAAEVILRSHVRAHWVVGHWRNQPFGEGRKQRHQTWIKPHIRGLGEAGATTVKVTAQKGRGAEAQKPEGTT